MPKIRITKKTYRNQGTVTYDPVVHYEGRKLVINRHVPLSITKLMPHGWGNAKPEDWRSLVNRAIIEGLL